MNRITLCMAYYENPGMLRRHLELISTFDRILRQQIDMIVVDDGSPTSPALPVVQEFAALPVGFSLFRMLVDVPWNMDACRNLAVLHTLTDWVLLTDIDHLVPEKTWRKILGANLHPGAAYKFGRVSEPELSPYKQHPNTWLMSRDLYDMAGGYDERFAGWYGTDGDFRNRLKKIAPVHDFKEPIIRVPREVTPDASTTTLVRRSPENLAALDRIKREREANPKPRTMRNRFPWERQI